jgi:hypothetical protein
MSRKFAWILHCKIEQVSILGEECFFNAMIDCSGV